jgi:hypothetical protein
MVAAARPVRVLRCAPAKVDRRWPLYGLAQLLSSVTQEELAALPSVHRETLATVTAGRADAGGTVSTVDVGYALLSLVQVLSTSAPLRLVVESAQWLDPETNRAVRFVASRVDGLPVHTVLSEQIDGSSASVGHRLCPPPLLILWLPGDEWRGPDGTASRS